jgi:hypothetical protein
MHAYNTNWATYCSRELGVVGGGELEVWEVD